MDTILCRLCRAECSPIGAHIIARSLLRLLAPKGEYDGKLILVGKEFDKPINKQGGSKDDAILCGSCDTVLGIYDAYIANFLKSGKLLPHKSGGAWLLGDANINKLKLFTLSYLWRCSITNLDEFKGVDLGPSHEEAIRKILFSGKIKDSVGYNLIMTKFEAGNLPDAVNMQMLIPAKQRHHSIMFYEIHLPMLYKLYLKVDKQKLPYLYEAVTLEEGRQNVVLARGDFINSKDFKILFDAVH